MIVVVFFRPVINEENDSAGWLAGCIYIQHPLALPFTRPFTFDFRPAYKWQKYTFLIDEINTKKLKKKKIALSCSHTDLIEHSSDV